MSTHGWRAMLFVVTLALATPVSVTQGAIMQGELNEPDQALKQAVERGDLEGARAALASGANVDLRFEGVTPLWAAVRMKHPDIAGVLIKAGADVDAADSRGGVTPLMLAAGFGQTEVVQLLLDSGAKVNAQAEGGATALAIAEGEGLTQIAKMLREAGASVELGRETAFLMAIEAGNASKVRELSQAGIDVNQPRGDLKETPLILAVHSGHPEVVSVLIEAGCDLEARDGVEKTALRAAVEGESVEIAKALIEAGANVNAPSERMGPMLWSAITSVRAARMVQLLVQAGIDINEQDQGGWTALMLAASDGDVDAARALIEAGADVNLRNKNGDTALKVATSPDQNQPRAARSAKVAAILRAAGAKE